MQVIDLRSFSNLWYWIGLAVIWSCASHWVIGVPFDMITRARRHGGQAQADLETLVRINVERTLYIVQTTGLFLLGFACFVLTMLALLGWLYRTEFAQAVFLILFPLTLSGLLSIRTCRRIWDEEPLGDALHHRLIRHRQMVQLLGMVAIFVTALWGMYRNLTVSPLFG